MTREPSSWWWCLSSMPCFSSCSKKPTSALIVGGLCPCATEQCLKLNHQHSVIYMYVVGLTLQQRHNTARH
jgi:hypothetical protein